MQPHTHGCGSVDIFAIRRQQRKSLFLSAMDDLDIRRQMGPWGYREAVIKLDALFVPQKLLVDQSLNREFAETILGRGLSLG